MNHLPLISVDYVYVKETINYPFLLSWKNAVQPEWGQNSNAKLEKRQKLSWCAKITKFKKKKKEILSAEKKKII